MWRLLRLNNNVCKRSQTAFLLLTLTRGDIEHPPHRRTKGGAGPHPATMTSPNSSRRSTPVLFNMVLTVAMLLLLSRPGACKTLVPRGKLVGSRFQKPNTAAAGNARTRVTSSTSLSLGRSNASRWRKSATKQQGRRGRGASNAGSTAVNRAGRDAGGKILSPTATSAKGRRSAFGGEEEGGRALGFWEAGDASFDARKGGESSAQPSFRRRGEDSGKQYHTNRRSGGTFSAKGWFVETVVVRTQYQDTEYNPRLSYL